MSKIVDKKLIFLVLATAILIFYTVFIVSDRSSESYEKPKTIFLEKLQGNGSDVATVVVFYNGNKTTIRKIGADWQIVNKYNYVVDELTISKLIISAEQLKIVEKKTSNPDRLGELGLGGKQDKDSYATRIIMSNLTEDTVYADFIRGRQRGFGKLETEEAVYVRNSDENQAWLVKGDLTYIVDYDLFLNKSEYKVERDRIMRVSYIRPDDIDYEISRMMPTSDFEISTPSKEAHSKSHLNRMGLILNENFKLIDVKPAPLESFESQAVDEVEFITYDGLKFIVSIAENNGQGVWVRLSATHYKDSAKKEAERINIVAKGWFYKVSDDTAKLLTEKLDDIIYKPKQKK